MFSSLAPQVGRRASPVYLRAMTKLLDKAIAEARKLPPEDQDALGARLLEELADEARWAKSFAEHPEVLEKRVAEAEAEIEAGEVFPLEFPPRK